MKQRTSDYWQYQAQCPALMIGLMIALLAVFSGCSTTPAEETLNSDRIRAHYGSYGVDVLYADTGIRVSSLFSRSGTSKTTRTFAAVQIVMPVPSAISAEHREIVDGASIGEVFRAHGWSIMKEDIFVGDLDPGKYRRYISALMQIPDATSLASHVYVFSVSDGHSTYDYATIIEVHHPDYLDSEQLAAIYGETGYGGAQRGSLENFVELPAALSPES